MKNKKLKNINILNNIMNYQLKILIFYVKKIFTAFRINKNRFWRNFDFYEFWKKNKKCVIR